MSPWAVSRAVSTMLPVFIERAGGVVSTWEGGDPREGGMVGSRAVVVVAPDGTIAEVIPRFNQVDPAAYEQLAAVYKDQGRDELWLATLELVFVFPGLILHTYLREARGGQSHVATDRRWR